jgi:hypothetical protein
MRKIYYLFANNPVPEEQETNLTDTEIAEALLPENCQGVLNSQQMQDKFKVFVPETGNWEYNFDVW